MQATFVIIGGGIAGVSCAESISFLAPEESIILITDNSMIKTVTNVTSFGQTLMQYDVTENSIQSLTNSCPSIKIIHDLVVKIDKNQKSIFTKTGKIIFYKKLCICTGAQTKLICENNDRVLGIRDVESVENLLRKLKGAKKIVIIGNGGIATELVHEINGSEVVWVIKDKHISATFIDPGAAEFFQEKIFRTDRELLDEAESKTVKRMRYTIESRKPLTAGPALGPDWHNNFKFKDLNNFTTNIQVEYQCEVLKIMDPSEVTDTENWPIYVGLNNGKTIGCDIIISATGVVPNSHLVGLESLKKEEDGGYSVDWKLETSEMDIFAAGDVCTTTWINAQHWFQMRLWTQAHQMGRYAAKCMISRHMGEDFLQDFCFELFTHVTKFFGYKVILLGLFNGQKLGNDYEILLRVTKGIEYVKLILKDGKLQGAILIGETDLEEMCENLILNQLDLSIYGEDLLNPNIDIEDYFD